MWNKIAEKLEQKKFWHLCVVFVFCKWGLKFNSVFIISGYWEYFSDAEKVLYLFHVRVVLYAGICTSVPLKQFYKEKSKNIMEK